MTALAPQRSGALRRLLVAGSCAVIAMTACGCDGRIYVRDGVTDGDTFYLPPYVLADDGADLQSWVAYSLDRSACQLSLGGPNPARNTSFECELGARETLVETWLEQRERKQASDDYLNTLAAVASAGYLAEYVWRFHAREGWRRPRGLQLGAFDSWQRQVLAGHRPQTRIVGSWNYREDRAREQAFVR